MNEILGVGLKIGVVLHVVAVSPSEATLDEVRFGLKSARICFWFGSCMFIWVASNVANTASYFVRELVINLTSCFPTSLLAY